MTLRESIRSDVLGVFLQTDEFAELISYFPRAGGEKSIRAIVDREPVAIYEADGSVLVPKFTIEICNCCTSGMAAKSIDTGGDYVEMIAREGGDVRTRYTVMRIVSHDMGTVILALV